MTKDDERHKDHQKRCRKAYSVDFSTTSNTAAASGFLNVRQTEQRRYAGMFPFLSFSFLFFFNNQQIEVINVLGNIEEKVPLIFHNQTYHQNLYSRFIIS